MTNISSTFVTLPMIDVYIMRIIHIYIYIYRDYSIYSIYIYKALNSYPEATRMSNY